MNADEFIGEYSCRDPESGCVVKNRVIVNPLKLPNKEERQELMFSHLFAKALCGTHLVIKDMFDDCGKIVSVTMRAWRWYLHELALEENRMAYLKECIKRSVFGNG